MGRDYKYYEDKSLYNKRIVEPVEIPDMGK
jgi:hypothetical protein